MERAIALFGGSFDPLTNAHLSVIRNLAQRFERVVVVPSHISPFKQDANALCDETRLAFLDECCKNWTNVEISRFETDSDEVSYTYKTVAHYKTDGMQLYFVIGTDMIDGLDRWKNIAQLSQNAIFYVINRPYFGISEQKLECLKTLGYRFRFADFDGEEGSSSLLKVALAFNKESEVAPAIVCEYVRENGLYSDYEFIVKAYEKFGMKQSRIDHTYRAVKVGIILAKTYNESLENTIMALLMHDIGKYVSAKQLQSMGIPCSNVDDYPDPVRHCFTSKAIAKHYLGVKNEDVLSAIENHTTARAKMSMLEKIVFIADYIEEGRTFDGVENARKLAYTDIDRAIIVALQQTIDHLKKEPQTIDERTISALEYLKNQK